MAVAGTGDEVAMAAGSASGGSGGTTMAAARIHSLGGAADQRLNWPDDRS
jgi:hypothetical protein